MWTPFEPWQIAELQRLSERQRDEVESGLNALWESHPELLEEITIGALDRQQISAGRAAQVLGISEPEALRCLARHRRRALRRSCIVLAEGCDAKLADGGLPVWEVVRVYRRVGSVAKLQQSLKGISLETLGAALVYANENAEEIEAQIAAYEAEVQKRSAAGTRP